MLTRRRLRRFRSFRLLFTLFVLYSTLEVLYIHHVHSRQSHHVAADPPPKNTRIYIASIHWNTEEMLRTYWNDAVVTLAKTLGPENVFMSVYESGSLDDSKEALKLLDYELGKLGVPRNITLSNTTHFDEVQKPPIGPGWIETRPGRKDLRRIPYLSRLRNYSLWNLEELFKKGIRFDKILFLNDVVFTNNDIFTLLETNNGQYAAACSLDFSKPPLFYDTFALRDSDGREHVTQTWPYFRSHVSRHAMKMNEPVPVASCWNGIVAMPTTPFLPPTELRFRGIPDSLALRHLEGSECCLIHADNPHSNQGIFLNPRVRVGYNGNAYASTHPKAGSWLSSWQMFKGLWQNRLRRWLTTPMFKEWLVRRRVNGWLADGSAKSARKESGVACLINEMQVLVWNGWAHV